MAVSMAQEKTSRLGLLKRFPVVLLVVLVFLLAPAGTIQGKQSDSYQSELLDWTVATTGPNYVLDNVAVEEYPHGRGERIYLSHVNALGFAEISFFDDEDEPAQTVEVTLRDFESASASFRVLESGKISNIEYALARFDLGSARYGYVYIEVAQDVEGNVDFAQSMYALSADFLEQIEIAQGEISINGNAFLSQPVIDFEALVVRDIELVASTPEPVATPQRGGYTFRTNNAELVVEAPIEYNFPYTNNQLEVMFLQSEHGYGIVGFIHDNAGSAESVLRSMFIGAPTDDEAPVELYLEAGDERTFGVYRVQTQGDTRAMVIEVIELEAGLWQVQAMAVTESEFEREFENYQYGVTFDGSVFMDDLEAETILAILEEN